MNDSIKIIENGYVFTGDAQNRAGRLTIIIQNGRIVELGKRADALKASYPQTEVIDAAGKIILPGFVDAHHTGQSCILRYFTSGLPMSQWHKNQVMSRIVRYLSKEASYEEFLMVHRLSYYAALKSGVTTLAEYGCDSSERSFQAIIDALRQTNQRGIIGVHNGDQIEAARLSQESSIRFALVLADEENLTTFNIQSNIRSARDLQWPIMLHLGQTRNAWNIIKKNFNKSIAQLYSEYLTPTTIAHILHLSTFEEGDCKIIAKFGVPLIYAPTAILQNGTEIPPLGDIYKHKIRIAFGSDWGIARPLETIQSYCTILKVLGIPSERAYDLLACHTKNGAAALGLQTELGSIEPGKKADIVFLDLTEFRLSAVLADDNPERILWNILQEAVSEQVSDVMINGEFYVRQGHILIYSEEDLAREGHIILSKFLSLRGKQIDTVTSSAPILQFSGRHHKENSTSSDDVMVDEGFKIIRKDQIISPPRKNEALTKNNEKDLPRNINKVFGEDDDSSV